MKKVFFSALLVLFVAPSLVAAEVIEEEVVLEEAVTVAEETTDEPDALVRFTVRTEEGIVAQETLTLATTVEPVLITPTAGGEPEEVAPRSVLALLVALDALSETFTITDLQYFSSFGAFFLNCIAVSGSEELCGNWQYTVNGAYPAVGLDSYILSDNDVVYLFYGSPRIVTLASTTVFVHEPVTATLKEYDPSLGEYVPRAGLTLGVVAEDPDNPWTPIEVMTEITNLQGEAVFTIATSGTYAIGVREDFYFPQVPFTVVDRDEDEYVSEPIDSDVGGGLPSGGGGGLLEPAGFDVGSACEYIAQQQLSNGSFGAPLFTDWAAVALVACSGERDARERVLSYLVGSSGSFQSATDYQRRAIALMALGIDPYSGTSVDLISGMLGFFDGEQMGDPGFINDDVFALIVLSRAGMGDTDTVYTILAHVLATQRPNGAWPGGVDMTAAAVQALVPFVSVPGVHDALRRAEVYLRNEQGADGGFGNVFSTAWVLQAMVALGQTPREWSIGSNDPRTYLARHQHGDGGMDTPEVPDETRLWATSYAVLGALGKTWQDVMQQFASPSADVSTVSQGGMVAGVDDTQEPETEIPDVVEVQEYGVGDPSEDRLPVEAIRALIAYATSLREESAASLPAAPAPPVATHSAEGQVRDIETAVPAPEAEDEAEEETAEAESSETTIMTEANDEEPSNTAPIATYLLVALIAFLAGIGVGMYFRR